MGTQFAFAAEHTVAGRPTRPLRRSNRKSCRTPHRVACRVTLHDPESGERSTALGQTTNISARGLALQLNCDVAPGTWVETLVPHPNGSPAFFCGTVAHSRRVLADTFEIGVEFQDGAAPSMF